MTGYVFSLKKVCLTDRNIGYLYLYLYTYLFSCLLCGVGSSSLRYVFSTNWQPLKRKGMKVLQHTTNVIHHAVGEICAAHLIVEMGHPN